jgi:drug/metabolite transporter (DMT)-like permease
MVLLLLAPAFSGGALGLDLLGVLFALGAAGFQTAYALVAARGFASVPALQASTLLRGVAVLFYGFILVPLVVVLGEGSTLLDAVGSVEAWLLILTAGIIGAALPTVLLVAGYRRVGPTRGAVLMLVEPVIGVLLAALLLAERPEPVQLLGGLLVLTGAALVQLARSPRLAVVPASVAE